MCIYRCITNVLKPILLTGIADADPYARKAGRQLYWILKYKQNTTTPTITTTTTTSNSTMLYSMMDSIFIDNIEPLHQKHINTEYTTMSSDLSLLLNLSSGGSIHPSSLPLPLTSTTTDTTDFTATGSTANSDSSIGIVSSKSFSGSGTALRPNSASGPRRPSLRNTTTADSTSTQGLNTDVGTNNSNTSTNNSSHTQASTSTMVTPPLSTSSSMLPPRAPVLSGAVRLVPDRTTHTSSTINSSISGISSNSGGSSMVVSSRRMTLSAPVRMPVRPPTAPTTLPLPMHTPDASSIDMESVLLTNTMTTTTTATSAPMGNSTSVTTNDVENRSVPSDVANPDLNLTINCNGVEDGDTASTALARPLSSTSTRLAYLYICLLYSMFYLNL